MSHQTGIAPNGGLRMALNAAKETSSKVRALKIVIDDEQLCLDYQEDIAGSLQHDWVRMLPQCLRDTQPCYILMRLDGTDGKPVNSWILISYTPDKASIKGKMLHAATRSSLKSSFGAQFVSQEMQATTKGEATIEGWVDHCQSKEEGGPMSQVEAGLNSVHFMEAQQAHQQSNPGAVRGMAFPVDQKAEESLTNLLQGQINYVQMSVDTLNEAIKFEEAATVSPADLHLHFPKTQPRYHFYRFTHTHEGEEEDSIVFIYSMPTQGCTIKDKMLYSSCKTPFLHGVQQGLGVVPVKKVEIDADDVVDEQFLRLLLHPPVVEQRLRFDKPQGPARRPRRMVK